MADIFGVIEVIHLSIESHTTYTTLSLLLSGLFRWVSFLDDHDGGEDQHAFELSEGNTDTSFTTSPDLGVRLFRCELTLFLFLDSHLLLVNNLKVMLR